MLLQNRFLIVFGGGSVANCYNDVVMLDTKTLEWSSPQTTGTPPTPRAGTCQATVATQGCSCLWQGRAEQSLQSCQTAAIRHFADELNSHKVTII